jgi:deoxyribose-phosphate aldolase
LYCDRFSTRHHHFSATKAFETSDAIANGANEIDMVLNISALLSGNYELVEDDIQGGSGCGAKGKASVKVIFETAYSERMS